MAEENFDNPFSDNPELLKSATFLAELERKIDGSGIIEPIVAGETPEAAAKLKDAA